MMKRMLGGSDTVSPNLLFLPEASATLPRAAQRSRARRVIPFASGIDKIQNIIEPSDTNDVPSLEDLATQQYEAVKAYIVLKEGQSATEKEIVQFARDNLTGYRVPKLIEFRDSLPETLVGKVLRRVLQDEEKAKADKEG